MIEILHSPLGQEHPYEQLPEERFPRQPLAGQAFTLGIATKPPGEVQRVVIHRLLDGADQELLEAVNIANWRPELEAGVGAEFLDRMVRVEQDVWRVELTAPAQGSTLTYWVEADGQASARYTLRGESWQTGGGAAWDGQTLTLSRSATTLPATPAALHRVEWLTDGQTARRVRLTFASRPDEAFFGLGERFNALDQRGNVMDIRCYEQYKNQGKRTYMPVPFLLSSAGYGVHVHSNRWMQFDLAATAPDAWVLEADLGADERLSLTWFSGDEPAQIIGAFGRSVGAAALPPLWAFGLWMSGNEWNSQKRVEAEVRASFEHGITPSVMVIEAWSDETTFYIWNDAVYNPVGGGENLHLADFTFPAEGKWPNPKGMIDGLHAQNVRLLLWQVPVLKRIEQPHPQHEADHHHWTERGLGVREPDGSQHRVKPFWFRGGHLWDVTNPEARAWWLNKRAYLLEEMEIDGFKTDGGEHLWGADTRFGDGRKGDELWNEYPRLYTQAYYEFANARREAITFSRAGFTGSQTSPAHWAGDENSTWDAFLHSIYAGLSAGISGIPFWGWDIGGFSGEIPDAELYLRSAAMAVFCPIMQYHAEFNQHREPNRDRTPWNIQERTGDEQVIPLFRRFVNVRHALMPYIWQEAQHSAASGEPMMRALRLTDPRAADTQYFFGRDLLVCPITTLDVRRMTVYLPEGRWADFWTKAEYTGGQTIEVDVPLDRIPVFVRGGAVLPLRLPASQTLGDAVELSAEANAHW
jgi:alpha-glucosidase (family GH31 glycosyl hydrolase)